VREVAKERVGLPYVFSGRERQEKKMYCIVQILLCQMISPIKHMYCPCHCGSLLAHICTSVNPDTNSSHEVALKDWKLCFGSIGGTRTRIEAFPSHPVSISYFR